MEREKVALTGAPETMLATLYARALDSRAPRSVLHDEAAARAVERIDYDFRRTGITATTAAGVALRGRQLDAWTREFLDAHPEATVLHLACGLDTRAQRLGVPPGVRWIDLDHPDVVALRERLLPPPAGDYRLVASSVTDEGWLASVPADRPTVAVFEGLSMYLRKEDGRRLIERIAGRFPSGQLLFDAYGTIAIRLQKLVPAVRNAGATLHWGVDDPRELETWHAGLVLLDALRSVDMPGIDLLPPVGRLQMRVLSLLPKLRDAGWMLRYQY
jgi:O-methyltransferase involved in polyketide biosynthesis